jgi:hypothetical protein
VLFVKAYAPFTLLASKPASNFKPRFAIAFKITNSLRIHATKHTLNSFPTASNRSKHALTTGFHRRATQTAISSRSKHPNAGSIAS